MPGTLEELTNLPGVARKTAVLTLNEALGQFTGIGCDVHVSKMTEALGFMKMSNPNQLVGPTHAKMALWEFVEEHNYPKINKIFGSAFRQLFSQDIRIGGGGKLDPVLLRKVAKSCFDFIHQDCQMLSTQFQVIK